VAELEQQLKQYSEEKDILGEELKKKQNLIEQLHNTIFKLQAEISTLKSYIEKREGTFKWVVEREIEKDIQISEIQPQTYKVSQIREYSRDSNQ
jgi:predicted  nucleic acid-binding Zn-ribbon protein